MKKTQIFTAMAVVLLLALTACATTMAIKLPDPGTDPQTAALTGVWRGTENWEEVKNLEDKNGVDSGFSAKLTFYKVGPYNVEIGYAWWSSGNSGVTYETANVLAPGKIEWEKSFPGSERHFIFELEGGVLKGVLYTPSKTFRIEMMKVKPEIARR